MRAFVNWMVQEMNEKAAFNAGVVVVQPIANGLIDLLNEQDGLYTLYLNGIKNGEAVSDRQVIDCIQRGINPYDDYQEYLSLADSTDLRFVISNTTEAGIAYHDADKNDNSTPKSFPAKLTALMYKRFIVFKGDKAKGLIILPCELIDRNGDKLKSFVMEYARSWGLGDAFIQWIEEANVFCNTLVDRIVPGYPKAKADELNAAQGYTDNLIVEGEQFHLWVIEGPSWIADELPTKKVGLNVVFTDNMEPYRTRKVRILNGAHTSMVPVGCLFGLATVRETIENEVTGDFVRQLIFKEICPTLDLPASELSAFAEDVLDRFRNPFLHHELMSIALNSISKFKTRVLPSILEFKKRTDELPHRLVYSLATLIAFYKGAHNGKEIILNDDQAYIDFFSSCWEKHGKGQCALGDLVSDVLSKTDFWETNLEAIDGMKVLVEQYLQDILTLGLEASIIKMNEVASR